MPEGKNAEDAIPAEPEKLISARHALCFPYLWLLSIGIGAVSGLGAVAFRALIAFFHNLLFLSSLSLAYDANRHTPGSPWGPLVILVPVVGALGVSFLVSRFAPEAKGPGVREVMDSIYYRHGIIRPVVALIKALASALSIGSGGSVGREGPIIQIGSSVGSTLGQTIPMRVGERVTLMSAGAAAGIAATFNTPVGGILFAVELLMHEVSVGTLVPVAISSAVATSIGRIFFGVHPSFIVPSLEMSSLRISSPLSLVAFAVLGLVAGLASTLFIKSTFALEDFFDRWVRGSYYRRHVSGMLFVGVTIFILQATTGHYYVEGVGYATVQDVLSGVSPSLLFLLILFLLKLLATSISLGSGASGGVFSPSLFLGATIGGAYGLILAGLSPGLGAGVPAFALAGMAGMVAGSTGAALAAVVMIFEMTLDYNVILPMIVVVAVSYGLRKALSRESIYTIKLARRGHFLPEAMRVDVTQIQLAGQIMETHFLTIPARARLDQLETFLKEHSQVPWFLAADGDKIVGILANKADLCVVPPSGAASLILDLVDPSFVIVRERTPLVEVMASLRASRATVALVASRTGPATTTNILGLITPQRIARAVEENLELFIG